MKKALSIPLLCLLILLLTTNVFAAGDLSAERTSFGMEVNHSRIMNADCTHFCAVYDEKGRMLAVEEITADDSTVYCDVNAVRRVNLFSVEKNTCIPNDASVDTTLQAPEEPIHVHTWDKGTVTQPATCAFEGVKLHKCTASACDGSYEARIPRTDHTWGPWKRFDNDNHIRTCSMYDDHTETAPHNWELKQIISEPTYEQNGSALYYCSDCRIGVQRPIPKLEPKDVWFTYDAERSEFVLNWLPADELPSGHGYFVNGQYCYPNENYYPIRFFYVSLSDLNLDPAEITATADVVIETGLQYGAGERTTLYTVEDALIVTEREAAHFTLTGQTDGTYLIGANTDLNAMTVNARLIHDDGETELVTGTYNSPYINIYPWDGSAIELTAMVCTISEDTEHLTITRTPTETLTEFTRPAAPADCTVTTAEALQTALTVGGKVTLGADIDADSMAIYGGEPVTLDLNGHTLSVSRLSANHGKELTIIGDAAGSAIVGDLSVSNADKLTIHGGTYGALSTDWINTLSITDAELSGEYTAIYASDCFDIAITGSIVTSKNNNAMIADRGDSLSIADSTLTTIGVPDDRFMRYEALLTSEIETIRLIDVTASSVSGAAVELSPAPAYGSNGELYVGSSVTVRGGSYTSQCTNTSAAALQIKDFDTVEIGGVIDPASDPADLQIASACHGVELANVSGAINLSDITAQAIGDGTGLTNLFYIHNLETGGSVTATRLTGNGGRAHTFRVEDRLSLHLEHSAFTAPETTDRTPAPISVENVGTVTIDRTDGTGGYYGLYIFDCADADLSNMVLRGSTFGLNACNITALDAAGCEIYGNIYCWKNGNYTFASDCWLVGDVEANGDSGWFVTVDITGCFLSGKTRTNEHSVIIK